eukprot:Skav211883  [mRNA]  locus=scaffold3296:6148:8907:+ [translate_table: standard]
MHYVQIIKRGDLEPILVAAPPKTTVGMFTVAEERLQVLSQPILVTDAVGRLVPASEETKPFQKLFLENFTGEAAADQTGLLPSALTHDCLVPRIQTLYQQKGWVGADEMNFYLEVVKQHTASDTIPAILLQSTEVEDELANQVGGHIQDHIPDGTKAHTMSTAILRNHHWSPVMLVGAVDGLVVYTTPNMATLIEISIAKLGLTATVVEVSMQTAFPNDCGFQTIEWITAQCDAPSDRRFQPPLPPMQPQQAVNMRDAFEYFLRQRGIAYRLVRPCHIWFGGGNDELQTQLGQLLTEHGVPSDALDHRVHMIVEKMGKLQVAKCLRSTTPWKDLKSLANGQLPKIQLVLPGELADAISSRLKQPGKFGSKDLKKSRKEKVPKPSIQLAAEDISVPQGIFSDSQGNQLAQINVREIGPQASGLVVLDASEAIAYLRVSHPVSQKALAILIVNHADPRVLTWGTTIRLPARCERTGDPILLTGRLVQLGAIAVVRTTTSQSLKIDEVQATVIRTLVFRDELECSWESFMDRPVRHIIQQVEEFQPTQAGKSPIIDVWDRQFLNEKMERCNPTQAFQYVVAFRVESNNIETILQKSGAKGCYFEPRTSDGRAPSEAYRVIWLGKLDPTKATVARQSTATWACLVRNGLRFGVRVRKGDAEEAHRQHKPRSPFLDSQSIVLYQAGPMPFGATKETLSRLFAAWKWPARPLQPKQRSSCGTGMVWEVQATEAPAYEVWQCQHSDVLITKAPQKEVKPSVPQSDLQASARTIKALEAKKSEDKSGDDPWVKDDPWMTTQGRTKIPKNFDSLRQDQIDAIAKQVEQKIQANLPVHVDMTKGDNDEPMEDNRITQFEDRLAQLELTVHSQHTQQSLQNQDMQGKITSLHHQMEQQQTSLQQHFDNKMSEQLMHIEKLLQANKHARHE